jgi:hypothetical protein
MKKLLILPMLLFSTMTLYSQIEVKYFNAGWNAANEVTWVEKLSDCEIDKFDIGADPKKAQEFKVVVVPNIIIFQDGEEVERYQADISFKMEATREELQDYIDELIMSAF